MRHLSRLGVTLIELLIVLALIGVMAAVSGVLAPRRPQHTPANAIDLTLSDARRAAITTGRSVTISFAAGGKLHVATALADGSIITDSILSVDRLSGAPIRRDPVRTNDGPR